jgi:hypothetical protein
VLPDAIGGRALDSAGLVLLAGSALFAAPLLIWWRFSEQIASSGGLYAFTEAAIGRRGAMVQGGLWVISYVLYVSYTVTQVVYDLLPVPFPGVRRHQGAIEVLLPAALVLAIVLAERAVLWAMAALAVAQVALVIALGVSMLGHTVPSGSFRVGQHPGAVGRGIANTSLLFLCGGLPLFLGGEVAGGGRSLRRVIATTIAGVAALLVVTGFPLAAYADSSIAGLEMPGYVIALITSGHTLAVWVGAGAVASVLGLVVAEFLALTRLLRAATGATIRRIGLIVGAVAILADIASVPDPDGVYDRMITPSLVALYLSQLIVFAGYGRYVHRRGRLGPLDLTVVLISCALMVFGLEVVISQQTLI